MVKILDKLNALCLKRVALISDLLFTDVQQDRLNSLCSYHITVVGGLIQPKHKPFDSSESSRNIAQRESAKQIMM